MTSTTSIHNPISSKIIRKDDDVTSVHHEAQRELNQQPCYIIYRGLFPPSLPVAYKNPLVYL